MFDKNIYITRREKLKESVNDGLMLFLGNDESPANYKDNVFHFRQDSSFLYFFGIDSPGFAAIIDVESGEEIIFGNDFTMDDIIWMGHQCSISDRAALTGVLISKPFHELSSVITEAIRCKRKVHFLPPYRSDNMLILEGLLGIKTCLLQHYASREMIDGIVKLRSIKEECEIIELKKAWETGYKMHLAAMQMALGGVMEYTIAGVINGIALLNNHNISFPIILSQNGEVLHNHNHHNRLQEGKLMLVDAGAESTMHYSSDFTRTSPVGGKFTQQQREIYEIVLAANNRSMEITKAGVTYKSVHLEAARVIAYGLKNLGIMKGDIEEAVQNGAHALFFPHGLGHMMGLDVHDMEDLGQVFVGFDEETRPSEQFGLASLRLGRRLKAGFVLTNEPGIYFIPKLIEKWEAERINADFINFDILKQYLNFGGIRIEDDLLVTEAGCELLGKRLPVTIEEVENTIQSKKEIF